MGASRRTWWVVAVAGVLLAALGGASSAQGLQAQPAVAASRDAAESPLYSILLAQGVEKRATEDPVEGTLSRCAGSLGSQAHGDGGGREECAIPLAQASPAQVTASERRAIPVAASTGVAAQGARDQASPMYLASLRSSLARLAPGEPSEIRLANAQGVANGGPGAAAPAYAPVATAGGATCPGATCAPTCGQTCGGHATLCGSTCQTTCQTTCQSTCQTTCASTCASTCSSPTCGATCASTCASTCSGPTCAATCASTCVNCGSSLACPLGQAAGSQRYGAAADRGVGIYTVVAFPTG
jgi:hypothetical protein